MEFKLNEQQRADAEGVCALIIDDGDTDVTVEQVKAWSDYDLKEWLETWGYEWHGSYLFNPACQEVDEAE